MSVNDQIFAAALKYIKEEEQQKVGVDEEAEMESGESLLSADRNKKHAVWAYFSERGENIVCNIGECLRRYKSPATTTTLMYHLEHGNHQHQLIFNEILKPGCRKKNDLFFNNFPSTSKSREMAPETGISSCTSTPTNKRVISFNTKLAIIEAAKGNNKSQLARQFNLPKSTVKGILSNKEAILKAICQGKDSRKSRLKPAKYIGLEEALVAWTNGLKSENIPLTGTIIKEKAREMAAALQIQDFQASSGWLENFKKRHSVLLRNSRKIPGAISPVDWQQHMVREMISVNDSFGNGSMDSCSVNTSMTLSDQLLRNDDSINLTDQLFNESDMSESNPNFSPTVTDEQLIEHAVEAMKNSYSPYSNFPVGAALLTTDGTVFKGTNVENASSGGTICAERSALVSAVVAGHKSFQAIAVVSQLDVICAPCGICRQCMVEFGNYRVIQYSPSTQLRVDTTVRELLPMAFTPHEFSLLPAKK